MDNQENTELVDIAEVSEVLLDEPEKPTRPENDSAYLEHRTSIANLRERFAAFFIDSLLFFYLYFVVGAICRRAFYDSWDGPIPSYGWQGLAFHGLFIFICFMYYFILEGVFFSTLGKFSCWMYVRQKNGSLASMSSIFARNVFRIVDYLLPILPFFLMELTGKRQRLGDLIGGTMVVKRHSSQTRRFSVTPTNLASASGRLVSSVIDFIICFAMTVGYIFLLSPDNPGLSKWLLLILPIVPMLYFVISEPLTGTTPGKWLFGYVITHDDGSIVSLSGSILRTFMRFFDSNLIGLICLWLSSKKQRIGDLAADTIVSKQKRDWKGGVALAVWLVVGGGFLWLGMQNEKNILSEDFKFNFIPAIEFMGASADESAYKELTLTHIRFASGDVNTMRTPPVFRAGETVYIITDVYGYERSGRMVWIQEDLDVRYPDTSIALHQENIVDYHQVVPSRGPVELTNSVKLPDTASAGVYSVTITVRDLFGHEQKVVKQTFEVKF